MFPFFPQYYCRFQCFVVFLSKRYYCSLVKKNKADFFCEVCSCWYSVAAVMTNDLFLQAVSYTTGAHGTAQHPRSALARNHQRRLGSIVVKILRFCNIIGEQEQNMFLLTFVLCCRLDS